MDLNIGQVIAPLAREGGGGAVSLLGTCFPVSERKFATASHVVGPIDQGLAVIVGKKQSLISYQDTTDLNVNLLKLKISEYDPIYDIAILEFLDPTARVSFTYDIAGTDSVLPGSKVFSLGYPHADHGRLVLTQQSSSVGARVLLGGPGGMKIKHVVLNTQTRPGQSGGPVFIEGQDTIVAMITGGYTPIGAGGSISLGGIDPQTLHQTTHAISTEYIKDML